MQTGKFLRVFLLMWISFLLMASSVLAETDWKLSVSGTYETGKYGTGTPIDTFYLPVTLKRYFDIGDVSLTVPFISQKGNNEVTFVDGMVFRKPKPSKTTSVTTNSGLGDIILKGSFYLLAEQRKDQPLDLFVIGKIKFPTADRNKNLGTGEYDETIGIELGKTVLPQFKLFVDGYYTFIGSPPGIDLKNRFLFDAGASLGLTSNLIGSLFYEESTQLVGGLTNERDVAANVEYKITRGASIFAGGSVGLNTSSPDYSLTGGAAFRF